MSSTLDKSLDDIISSKQKTSSNRKPRNDTKRGGKSVRGARKNTGRTARRSPPRRNTSSRPLPRLVIHNEMADTPKRLYTGGRVKLSNLEWEVSQQDLDDVFRDVVGLKSLKLQFDRSGRSLGYAMLDFDRRSDAEYFVERYDGVKLDERKMQVELWKRPEERRPHSEKAELFGSRLRRSPARKPVRGVIRGRERGTPGQKTPRPTPARKERPPKPTAEDLDADLDAYMNS